MGILEGISAIGQKVASAINPGQSAQSSHASAPAQEQKKAQAAKPQASNPVQQISRTITGAAGAVTGGVTAAAGAVSQAANQAGQTIGNAAGAAGNKITSAISGAGKAVGEYYNPTQKGDTPLKVMSFNVDKMEGANSNQLAGYIKKNKPDVVCLQELDQNQAKDLANKTGMYVSYQGAGGAMNGKAILSKYPFKQETQNSYLSSYMTNLPEKINNYKSTGGSSMELRGTQTGTIDVNGKSVTIFNTHLSNSNSGERNSQLSELDNSMKLTPGIKVCAGDFNEDRGQNKNSQLNSFAKAFKDTMAEGGETQPTCGEKRLDYIFATQGVQVQQAGRGTEGLSDHYPIIASLLV